MKSISVNFRVNIYSSSSSSSSSISSSSSSLPASPFMKPSSSSSSSSSDSLSSKAFLSSSSSSSDSIVSAPKVLLSLFASSSLSSSSSFSSSSALLFCCSPSSSISSSSSSSSKSLFQSLTLVPPIICSGFSTSHVGFAAVSSIVERSPFAFVVRLCFPFLSMSRKEAREIEETDCFFCACCLFEPINSKSAVVPSLCAFATALNKVTTPLVAICTNRRSR
mmetsp:Transcript_28185/g.39354  ORF Transcript_28185/g.39354 Transcript_28185/m.39354 type:complete len:221 (-) Transcript_28185:247-909(-)